MASTPAATQNPPSTQVPESAALIRLVICVVLVVVFCIIRSKRQGRFLENKEYQEIGWFIAGTYLIVSLIVRSLINPQLLELVGEDGIFALVIGAGSQIIASLSEEIRKDFGYLYTKAKSGFPWFP